MPFKPEIPEGERGFILDNEFFPTRVSQKGKDLLLIDRLTQRPVDQVLGELETGIDVRGPSALALIAMSIRAAKPELPLQKVIEIVEEIDIGELEWIGAEDEEVEARPPVDEEASPEQSATSNGSQASRSETPSEIPV